MTLSNDEILHLLEACAVIGWLIVQLFTNGKISAVIVEITKTNGLISSHIASDEAKHGEIFRRLERLE